MKNENSKVVAGVDFSPESETAARQALEICRRGGHELLLVHAGGIVEVPPPSTSASAEWRSAVETYRAQLARALEEVRDRLADLRERLSDQGVTVSHVMVEDSPAQGICAVAAEVQARMTVVGAHGGGGIPWLPVGNVAAGVVRESDIDVLVALLGADRAQLAERRRQEGRTDQQPHHRAAQLAQEDPPTGGPAGRAGARCDRSPPDGGPPPRP